MAPTDRDVLLALYRSTDGLHWRNKTNWDTDADLSEWYGVKLNGEGSVVKLLLGSNNLRGHIPPELRKLEALETLDLGGIGSELRKLAAFKGFRLHRNQLTGHIPSQLGDLGALKHLDLSNNKLDGHIPKELGALGKLLRISLEGNELSGRIPKELGALSKLEDLVLFDNQLTGSIPEELGALGELRRLLLNNNRLKGPIPKELGALSKLGELRLNHNQLIDAPNHPLSGGGVARWREKLRGAGRKEPWAISIVDFLVALWHFLIPIFDDVTDVLLLLATFKDRGGLWLACCVAFVLADVERVLLFIVALLLVLCSIPFKLGSFDAQRRFKVVFKYLNCGRDLPRVAVTTIHDDGIEWAFRPSELKWLILDGFLWAVVGSRSRSSSLMGWWGMEGNTPVDVMEKSGFGLSLIDRIVKYHPYSIFGRALFACPHRHHLPDASMATRRSWVMLRAVGETLVVDSLFFALSLSSETWEDGWSIGVFSLIFSVLELLTELQYYAAEARADMVTDEEETMTTEVAEGCSMEVVNHAPAFGDAEDSSAAISRGGESTNESVEGSHMTAMKEAKVECEIAPSEGRQLQPAAHTVSTLATPSASGDAKIDGSLNSV